MNFFNKRNNLYNDNINRSLNKEIKNNNNDKRLTELEREKVIIEDNLNTFNNGMGVNTQAVSNEINRLNSKNNTNNNANRVPNNIIKNIGGNRFGRK